MKTKRKRNRRIIKILSDDEGMLPCRQRQVTIKTSLALSREHHPDVCSVKAVLYLEYKEGKDKGQEKEMRCRAFCAVSDTPAAAVNQES